MLAVTIVVALRTVGVALVAAMLVTPPAAAYPAHPSPAGHDGRVGFIGVVSAVGGL